MGLVALTSVGALLAIGPAVAAGPAWTGSGTGTTTVVDDGTAGPAQFTYDNGGQTDGGDGASGNWTFQTTAVSSGTVNLAWSYAGSDAYFDVKVGLSVFVTHDGVTSSTTLVADGPASCCAPPSQSFAYSGTTSIAVANTDIYGFTMSGSNFDTNTHLYGTLNVTRTYTPTISTAASAQQPVGQRIGDTATLTGTAPGATGTITFNAYGNSQCSGAPLSAESALVSGDGTYDAPGFIPPGAGIYYWTASYSGDTTTQSVSEGCGGAGESTTVATPSIATTATAGPVPFGTSISDTAILSGVPSSAGGTITFAAYTNNQCTGAAASTESVAVSGEGSYSAPGFVPGSSGTYSWGATYSGDPVTSTPGTSEPCGAPGESTTVDPPPPTLVTSATASPVSFGAAIADTAVLGRLPQGALGTITFKAYADSHCATASVDTETASVSGPGAYTITGFRPASAGTYYWTASYSGDPVTGAGAVSEGCGGSGESTTVNPRPTISTTPSTGPVTLGGWITDSAVLSGTQVGAAGTITFSAYTDPSCASVPVDTETAAVSGDGTYTIQGFQPASAVTYYWTASYSGDLAHATAGVSSACGEPTIVTAPINDAWTRAQLITLNNGAGGASDSLDLSGQARWYKVPVTPGGSVQVDLTNLPANYDLSVFSDIGQAFDSLTSPDDLQTVSAQYASDAFSPSVFSPSVFSPSVFSPSVFSPSVFSPSVFSPSVFSPSVFSPSVFSPSVFSPSVFSPSVFSPSVFSPSVFSSDAQSYEGAQVQSLIAISANDGTANEHVYADAWNNTGYFYIRVNGRNGAYDPGAKFNVAVEEDAGTCGGVIPANELNPVPALLSPATVPASVETLILTDPGRMSAEGDPTAMEAELQTFAGLSSVNGAIVDLGATSPEVTALNAQADAHPDCAYAKNLVAGAIRDIVTAYRQANPGLKYIVLVGNDHVIPFFRYPDTAGIGPESNYSPPVLDTSASQAALQSNDVLSQDAYGAKTVIHLSGVDVPIPDLPVGRLVETPSEISGMLDAYINGTIQVNGQGSGIVNLPAKPSSLVTGYDFMTSGAKAVEANLAAGLGPVATDDTLIQPDGDPPSSSWTADDLRTALLGSRHDLIFLAGHFSANNTLAADFSTTMNSTELADSSVNLVNSIVFSAGCHSGYNIVNDDAVPGVTQPVDWAEAFAQKEATLIAGTGYQYGDTSFLAYSEQLYADFSQALLLGTGPVAVGDALVQAKNTYLAATTNLQGIDIKSLLEATLYGLPMLSVDMPDGRSTPPPSSSIVGTPSSPLSPETTNPGKTLGLSFIDLPFSPALSTETTQLESTDGSTSTAPTATYLEGPDSVSSSPGAPTLPLAVSDVSVPNDVLRGIGFRSGTYIDTPKITPLTGAPATDLNGVHSTFSSSAFFPSRPWSVNYFGGLSGGLGTDSDSTQLMLTPAQYESDGPGSLTDIQRVYSNIDLRLFYSGNTTTYGGNTPALAAPPTISRVDATTSGGAVTFTTHVVGDPSAGIQQVWVTYTGVDVPAGASGEWESLDLTQDPTDSTLWSGTLSGLGAGQIAALQFVVQAANGVGLVGLDDNQGSYYRPDQIQTALQTSGGTLSPTTLQLSTPPPTDGSYGASIPVSATLTGTGGTPLSGEPVSFSVGGSTIAAVTDATGTASANLTLDDLPGSDYQLSAAFNGTTTLASTSSSTSSFTVDQLATTLTPSGTATVNYGGTSSFSATLANGSVGLSGYPVAFVLTPSGATSGSPVIETATTGYAGVASIAIGTQLLAGTYTVTAYFGPGGPITLSTDPIFAPSAAAPSTLTVVDPHPPSITGSALPAANAAGWNNTAVTVSFICADPGGTVVSCSAPTILGAGAGQSVTGSVSDAAGTARTTTVSQINIDETAPALTGTATTSPNAHGWYNGNVTIHWTCSVSLSGIAAGACPADSVITGEGQTLTAGASVTDRAGNTTAATSAPVKIDRTAPVTTASAPSGWSHTGVTVTLSPTDNLSGVAATYYTVDGGPTQTGTSIQIASDGTHTISFWSVDLAGNTESAKSATVMIDTTAPTITHTLSPLANGAGWNKTAVTVTFHCSAPSGIATCTGPQTVSTEGKLQPVHGSATNNAGTSASDTAYVSIDETPPVIAAAADRAANAKGWYNGAVKVSFTCSDTLSGIAFCPATITLAKEGAGQSAVGTATDAAGNSATATLGSINIDLTAPVVSITGVSSGANYASPPTPVCHTSDALSGVSAAATLTVTSGSGLKAGMFTATCSGGTDVAGNLAAPVSVSYTVSAPLGSGTTSCSGVYSGSGGQLVVPSGAVCTLLAGSHLSGNVQVGQGGSFNDAGAVIGGNLQATNAATIELGGGGSIGGNLQLEGLTGHPAGTDDALCNTKVGGNVQVQANGAAADVDLGNLGACSGAPGLTIGGNLQVQSNAAPATVSGNTVNGNLQVQSNTAKVTVSGNSAKGNIQVRNNTIGVGGTLTGNSAGGNCQLSGNNPKIVGSGNTAKAGQQNTCNATA